MTAPTPEVSVLLPTDGLGAIRKTLAVLRAQIDPARIEIVVITPADLNVGRRAAELAAFPNVVVLQADVWDVTKARAAGVRAASAPLVLFAETHAYPEPGYLEALIAAHEGPWTVVGPAMANENPGSAVSWAGLLMDYGTWLERHESEELPDVPGHNSMYKREALLAFGDQLETEMRSDSVMHRHLSAQGCRMYLESAARLRHLNVSSPLWYVVERFTGGRLFASLRSEDWPTAKRLAYAAGSPLIPLVRLMRIRRAVKRIRPGVVPARAWAALVPGLLISALGEAFGYAASWSGGVARIHDMEMHRKDYVRLADRLRDDDERRWPAPA